MSNKQGADYIFEKTLNIKKQKQKEKKHKKLIIVLFVFLFLALILFYVNSDFSKVQYINIKGLSLLSDQDIYDVIDIKEGDFKLLINTKDVKNRINDLEFVNDCNVSIDTEGNLQITVIENRCLGYYQTEDGVKILFDDMSTLKIENSEYKYLVNIPLLKGFSEEQITNDLYPSLLKIESKIISKIIKIELYPLSYDAKNVSIQFDDGNYVLCSMDICECVNNYYNLLTQLKVNNSCIFFNKDIPNGYAKECPWVEEARLQAQLEENNNENVENNEE